MTCFRLFSQDALARSFRWYSAPAVACMRARLQCLAPFLQLVFLEVALQWFEWLQQLLERRILLTVNSFQIQKLKHGKRGHTCPPEQDQSRNNGRATQRDSRVDNGRLFRNRNTVASCIKRSPFQKKGGGWTLWKEWAPVRWITRLQKCLQQLEAGEKRDWFVNQACPLFSSSLFPWCLPSGRYTNNFPCKTHTPQAEQLSGLVSAWKADAISVHVRKERGNVNPSIPRFGPLLYHWIRQFRCAVQEAAS